VASTAAGEIALTDAAAGVAAGAAAPAAASIAGAGGIAGTGISATEALSAATSASALYRLSQGSKGINVPPSPQPGLTTDRGIQDAEQAQLRRAQTAGGLQGSTGTEGGQAGAILNPATLSTKTLLGA
jgi:hypothetical protein